ncbi:hypothetical protein PG988_012087 [Apiospora saccharicola]
MNKEEIRNVLSGSHRRVAILGLITRFLLLHDDLLGFVMNAELSDASRDPTFRVAEKSLLLSGGLFVISIRLLSLPLRCAPAVGAIGFSNAFSGFNFLLFRHPLLLLLLLGGLAGFVVDVVLGRVTASGDVGSSSGGADEG